MEHYFGLVRLGIDATFDGERFSDGQLLIAYSMAFQRLGKRRRRATSNIAMASTHLGSRRDRSLAAALPMFWDVLNGLQVYVLTVDDDCARADVDLYQALNERMGGLIKVAFDERDVDGSVTLDADRAGILIGAAKVTPPGRQALFVRLSPVETKRACRVRGVAGVPDP